MSKTIDAKKKNILSIFSDLWFLIPEYQRSYVWNNDNIEELLDDLWYAFEHKPKSEYFLGSLVLKKTEEESFDEFEVLDGQQRLTTFFIIMAVMRDLTENVDLKEACQERIYQKANRFKGIPERIRIVYKIRDNVETFIKEYILEEGGTKKTDHFFEEIDSKNISISNMAKAIITIISFFSKKEEAKVTAFGEFIGIYPIFIYVSTVSREDAFRMFTILNNRGIPLTSADILKSMNIGKISEINDQKKYAQIWESIEGELGEDFDRFLSFIRTIIVKEKARLNLLDEFEDNIYDKKLLTQGKDTVDYIKKTKQVYDHVIAFNGESKLSNEYKNLLTIMDVGLPSKDWIPPLLLFYRKFGDKQIYDFLKKLEFKFSSDWILQLTPTQRIDNMNIILKSIEKSSSPTDVLCDTNLFEVNITELKDKLSGEVYQRRFARYVLLKYEFLLGENTVHLSNYKTISVEHVLPQNPKHGSLWKIDFTHEEQEYWTNRLANLVLISRSKNSKLSNSDFNDKYEKYLKTRMDVFPSNKLFLTYTKWTPETLKLRQNEIINKLINL